MKETLADVVCDYIVKLDEIEKSQEKKHALVVKQKYQEAAIERIKENELHKEALVLLAKMKKLRKRNNMENLKWISVKDSLPEKIQKGEKEEDGTYTNKSDTVLVAIEKYDRDRTETYQFITVGDHEHCFDVNDEGDYQHTGWNFDNNGWEFEDDSYSDDKLFKEKGEQRVTHWMPLPKMPII